MPLAVLWRPFMRSGLFALRRAIRIEPGNLCLRETAWWGWEDSNF